MEGVGGWLVTGLITVLIAFLAIKGIYYQYRKIKEGQCVCSGGCSCRDQACAAGRKITWEGIENISVKDPRDVTRP